MAHGGVRALVVAYARGDARCRADVMDALAALALTAKSLAELKTDSAALLLLLRFKAAAASSTSEASAQTTAHAERALGHIAASPALVFVYALQTCAKQVDKFQRPWIKDARRGWVLADAPDRDASVGVGLLRPGIDDLLRLACNGVEAEARHGGAADVLVSHGALKLLDDIIKVRDAAVVATVAGALASLLQQVGSRPCDDATRDTCKDVADRLLSLVWPLSHRAARTVQQAFMRKRHNQNWGGCALVVATPRLVGLLALALERADLHLDLGLYLVRRGALDALAARLAPDGHARDEVFGARVDDSHLGLGDRHAAADAVRASAAAPRHLPPVVQVLSRSRASPCTRRRTPPPGTWRGPCPSWAPSTGARGAGTSRRSRCGGCGRRPRRGATRSSGCGPATSARRRRTRGRGATTTPRRGSGPSASGPSARRCAPISRTSGTSARRRASARAASWPRSAGARGAAPPQPRVDRRGPRRRRAPAAPGGAGRRRRRRVRRARRESGRPPRRRGLLRGAAGAPPARARGRGPLRPVHPVAARAARRGGRGDRRPRERHRRAVGGAREAVPGARRRGGARPPSVRRRHGPQGGRRPDGPRPELRQAGAGHVRQERRRRRAPRGPRSGQRGQGRARRGGAPPRQGPSDDGGRRHALVRALGAHDAPVVQGQPGAQPPHHGRRRRVPLALGRRRPGGRARAHAPPEQADARVDAPEVRGDPGRGRARPRALLRGAHREPGRARRGQNHGADGRRARLGHRHGQAALRRRRRLCGNQPVRRVHAILH